MPLTFSLDVRGKAMTDFDVAFKLSAQSDKATFSIKVESHRQIDRNSHTLSVKYGENTERNQVNNMTAQKTYNADQPDNKARELASRLSLEEQVSHDSAFPDWIYGHCVSPSKISQTVYTRLALDVALPLFLGSRAIARSLSRSEPHRQYVTTEKCPTSIST